MVVNVFTTEIFVIGYQKMENKVTTNHLEKLKQKGQKITALTAYDYPLAALVDSVGVDLVLVGDSLGMTFMGDDNTLKVTIEDVAYHTRAVRKGIKRALLVADMPFMSYHVSEEKALENAAELIREGAEAVKLEGRDGITELIKSMLAGGIPVMGHIGLTPQSIHKLGGFKIQGREEESAKKLEDDALALENCGIFALVLECVPVDVAQKITEKLSIPTIGIGAGQYCDGQIMVTDDLLGLQNNFKPKFVKQYAQLSSTISEAVAEYASEVKEGIFPDNSHSYGPSPRHLKAM